MLPISDLISRPINAERSRKLGVTQKLDEAIQPSIYSVPLAFEHNVAAARDEIGQQPGENDLIAKTLLGPNENLFALEILTLPIRRSAQSSRI